MTLDALPTPPDAADAPDFYLMEFTDPTLLVPGTRVSIMWLAHAFASDHPFTLRQSTSQGTGSLTIKPIHNDTGAFIEADGHYLWETSQREALYCHAALQSLANSEQPVHQYLDPDNNQTGRQIVVSLGEYDDQMRGATFEH